MGDSICRYENTDDNKYNKHYTTVIIDCKYKADHHLIDKRYPYIHPQINPVCEYLNV